MIMLLMMIRMTKPYDYDDDTDDDNDHKNDSYTAAGAALGASVRCSLFLSHLNHKFPNETTETKQTTFRYHIDI